VRYYRRLRRAPEITLAAVFVIWIALAAPVLSHQFGRTVDAWDKLSGLSAADRELWSDPVAVQVARDIEVGVPADGCVTVLAYAGPDAADYYRGRLAYLLYPRQVRLVPRSGIRAGAGDCEYLAVFRDTPQNLRGSPFAGRWDQQELDERLAALETVERGVMAQVFRVPEAGNQ
jgi:hypothetical protein